MLNKNKNKRIIMKTIQNRNTFEVRRVSDIVAEKMSLQNWKYVPKATAKTIKEPELKFVTKTKKHDKVS
jgi:hypothetical protein